ncbi:capsid assembly scaffolding protein Gp46 family protein [Lactococcus insecticola]|uniref:Phage scaffold protein n=1 Tax=Pseudolactococcus insecticola TaxID=2709158 RepID=A0A6A0B3W2_9LACT|nr:DUF4355 domain-containing protein [Lactococcus insecticola]GFH39842.1 hypothetical protein Hs20B_02400 [Lactococcus insecticola]
MTEKNPNTEDKRKPEENTPVTFTQDEVDAMVSKSVTKATSELTEKIKQMQEASMTEQELAKQRQAEESAKQQAYVAQLERETRVNFAQTLLATNGLPSDQQFAEIYAGFDKENIKLQIEAQAKLIADAKKAEIDKLAQGNAPRPNPLPSNTETKTKDWVNKRDVLAAAGII